MKFTLQWLLDHLNTELSYLDIADKLTGLGIEVEAIIDNNFKFKDFVVGFVKSATQHPNADRLKVCQVDIGIESLNIVCGAANAREGIFVAVAKVGAVIPASNEPLKKGIIRSVESQGMMCSADELLINSEFKDGILELDESNIPGTPLLQALEIDDVVFDVSITPNRSDCFSVRGIARDLAALGVGELIPLDIRQLNRTFKNPVDIELKTDKCKYFSLTAIRNFAGVTPKYIRTRLKSIGQKLIFPAVDIANYICIDVGQPLHIFDLDKVYNKLILRESINEEHIKTLDGKETILPEGAVVVANEKGPLSIAGIMGGESSGCSENTKNILIEAAYFDKNAIAETGQNLRLSSDSRTRFERGIDPEAVNKYTEYTLSILASMCDCEISKTTQAGEIPNNRKEITLSLEKFKALTGWSEQDFKNSNEILESLGIEIKSFNEETIVVKTPSYRHDLEIEEDLIEEIIRLMGFDKIIENELEKVPPITQIYTSEKIEDALVFNGFYEVKTFSFLDKKTAGLFSDEEKLIIIKDPLTIDFSILRPTIISSHLKSIKSSQNKSQKNQKIFETGKRFYKSNERLIEENILTVTMSENKTDRTWRYKQEKVSIFDVKEILEKILTMVTSGYRLAANAPDYYHPGRSGSYIIKKDTLIAHFGEIHPSILSEMDIAGPIVCFELFLDQLPRLMTTKVKSPLILSQYQQTSRDFSFIVDKQLTVDKIINAIKNLKFDHIKKVSIFDVYEAQTIGEGKKAVALEVIMQSNQSTLTEAQINETSDAIIAIVIQECNGILRKQ